MIAFFFCEMLAQVEEFSARQGASVRGLHADEREGGADVSQFSRVEA